MKKYFKDLGFSDKEMVIIELLINNYQLTANQLLEESGLPKSTLFRILNQLKRKGIITHDFKKHHNSYRLSQPESLIRLISRKRREFRRMELELEELLNKIKHGKFKGVGNIEVYYNLDQFLALTERSLLAQEKIMYDFGNLDALWEVIGKNFDENVYVPERIQRGINLKMLIYDTPAAQYSQKINNPKLNKEIKIIYDTPPIKAYWKAYDDIIIIYSNIKEKFVVSIQSETISSLFKHMFTIMWNSL